MNKLKAALAVSLVLCMTAVAAQDAIQPESVKVRLRKNPGDVPYRGMLASQQRLLSYLPAEPRLIDATLRISFTELPLAEQDAYTPEGWAVSVVSDHVDETVPVARGGYFMLPSIPQAHQEDATVMFRTQSRRGFIEVGWPLRVAADHRLPYADFARAMGELHALQKRIPLYALALRSEKYADYDGLKACFRDADGRVLVDGVPVGDAVVGNCTVLRFDSTQAAGGKVLAFAGALDIVTLIDTRPYLATRG